MSTLQRRLCIGDIVFLETTDLNLQTPAVLCGDGRADRRALCAPAQPGRLADALFRVTRQRRYDAQAALESARASGASESHLALLAARARREDARNAEPHKATAVLDDVVVQLQHVASGAFLTHVPNELADVDRDCLRLELVPRGHAGSWLRLWPRHKRGDEAQPVLMEDEVALRLEGRPDEHVHASAARVPDYAPRAVFEANVGPATHWRLRCFAAVREAVPGAVARGDVVQLHFRELGAFLGGSGDALVDPLDDDEATAPAETLYRLEGADAAEGGALRWGGAVRLRHEASGRLLLAATDEPRPTTAGVAYPVRLAADGEAGTEFVARPVLHESAEQPHAAYAHGRVRMRLELAAAPGTGLRACAVEGHVLDGAGRALWCAPEPTAIDVQAAAPELVRDAELLASACAAVRRFVGAFGEDPRSTGYAWPAAAPAQLPYLRACLHTVRRFVTVSEDASPADRELELELERSDDVSPLALSGHGVRRTLRRRQMRCRELGLLDALMTLLHSLSGPDWPRLRAQPAYASLKKSAYMTLAAVVRGHRDNERRFAEGSLTVYGRRTQPYLSELLEQSSFSVDAAECLSTVIASVADEYVTDQFVFQLLERLAEPAAPNEPAERMDRRDADLALLRALCVNESGRGVRRNQLRILQFVFDERVARHTQFVFDTSLDPDPLAPREPLSFAVVHCGDEAVGADAALGGGSGLPRLLVSWDAEALPPPTDSMAPPCALEGILWVLAPEQLCEVVTGASWAAARRAAPPAELRRLQLLARLYVGQVALARKLCQDRAPASIALLQQRYPFELLLAGAASARLPDRARTEFLRLALALYVERHPHAALTLPRTLVTVPATAAELRAFTCARPPADDSSPVTASTSPRKFGLLLDLVVGVLAALRDGQVAEHRARNRLVAAAMDVAESLVGLGFLPSLDAAHGLLRPLVPLLDARRDEATEADRNSAASPKLTKRAVPVERGPRLSSMLSMPWGARATDTPAQPTAVNSFAMTEWSSGSSLGAGMEEDNDEEEDGGGADDKNQARYLRTDNTAIVQDIKERMCRTTSAVAKSFVDQRLGRWLARVLEEGADPVQAFNGVCSDEHAQRESLDAVAAQPLVTSCLDLLMFPDEELFAASFALLSQHLTPRRQLLDAIARLSVTDRNQRRQALDAVPTAVALARHHLELLESWALSGRTDPSAAVAGLRTALRDFRHLCTTGGRDVDGARGDTLLQSLLADAGVPDLVLRLLRLDVDLSAKPPLMGPTRRRSNAAKRDSTAHEVRALKKLGLLLLSRLVQDHHANQLRLAAHVDFFVERMGGGLGVSLFVAALFRHNRTLCQRVPRRALDSFAAHVAETRFAGAAQTFAALKWLDFFATVVAPAGHVIKRNQDLVLDVLLSCPDALLLLVDEEGVHHGFNERTRLMAAYDPAGVSPAGGDEDSLKLAFHVKCVELLAMACRGENVAAQARCQPLVPLSVIFMVLVDEQTTPLVATVFVRLLCQLYFLAPRADALLAFNHGVVAVEDVISVWHDALVRAAAAMRSRAADESLSEDDRLDWRQLPEARFAIETVVPALALFKERVWSLGAEEAGGAGGDDDEEDALTTLLNRVEKARLRLAQLTRYARRRATITLAAELGATPDLQGSQAMLALESRRSIIASTGDKEAVTHMQPVAEASVLAVEVEVELEAAAEAPSPRERRPSIEQRLDDADPRPRIRERRNSLPGPEEDPAEDYSSGEEEEEEEESEEEEVEVAEEDEAHTNTDQEQQQQEEDPTVAAFNAARRALLDSPAIQRQLDDEYAALVAAFRSVEQLTGVTDEYAARLAAGDPAALADRRRNAVRLGDLVSRMVGHVRTRLARDDEAVGGESDPHTAPVYEGTLRVLRAMLERALPGERPALEPDADAAWTTVLAHAMGLASPQLQQAYDDSLARFTSLQHLLCGRGVARAVVDALTLSRDNALSVEALRLAALLLEFGNATVQESVYAYVLGTKNHQFLGQLWTRIDAATRAATKRRRRRELQRGLDSNAVFSEVDNLVMDELDFGSGLSSSGSLLTDRSAAAANSNPGPAEDDEDDPHRLDLLFRVLQLLCEGHNADMQLLLSFEGQERAGFPVHHDLLGAAVRLLQTVLPAGDADGAALLSAGDAAAAVRGLEFLVEAVQGPCAPNQELLAEATGVIDVAMFALVADFGACPLAAELRAGAGKLLLGLLELRSDTRVHEAIGERLNVTELRARLCSLHGANDAEAREAGLALVSLVAQLGPELAEGMRPGAGEPVKSRFAYASHSAWLAARRAHAEAEAYTRAFRHFERQLLTVEVAWRGGLFRVPFRTPPEMQFFRRRRKLDLLEQVDPASTTRLDDFMQHADAVHAESVHLRFLWRYRLWRVMGHHLTTVKRGAFLLALLLNLTIFFSMRQAAEHRELPVFATAASEAWKNALGVLHVLLSFVMAGLVVTQRAPLVFQTHAQRYRLSWAVPRLHDLDVLRRRLRQVGDVKLSRLLARGRRGNPLRWLRVFAPALFFGVFVLGFSLIYEAAFDEMPVNVPSTLTVVFVLLSLQRTRALLGRQETLSLSSFVFSCGYDVLVEPSTAGALVTAIFSLLGLVFRPYYYPLLLLELVNMSQSLRNVVRAVLKPARTLLLTALLGTVVIFAFSAFAFFFLPDSFYSEERGENECETLYACMFSVLTNGLLSGGGIGEYISYELGWGARFVDNWAVRAMFDVSFFVLVVVLLLNIIFGIIIDTFAALRDAQRERLELLSHECFVCGIPKETFESSASASSFEEHLQREHNAFTYVAFLIYVRNKPDTELTGAESYVRALHDGGSTAWIPRGAALCVAAKAAAEGAELQSALAEQLSAMEARIDARMAQLEASVRRRPAAVAGASPEDGAGAGVGAGGDSDAESEMPTTVVASEVGVGEDVQL